MVRINNKKILHMLYSVFAVLLFLTGCKKDATITHNHGAAMSVSDFTAKQGGGGTEILITGSNFSTDTSEIKVTINGKQLAIVGASTTQVMAVVPKKCGSGNVVVRIGSDSAVSTDIFNYVFTRTVTTLAGSGKAGFANGGGADAMFNFSGEAWYRSMGVAVDDNLNVFVADPGNHCIRKIDSLGNVSTFVGNPNSSGYADGQGTLAKFSLPYDIAFDGEGNLFCVDPGNWDVRKISPDGNAVTWAWGSQAPWSVNVDKTSGYVYYSSCDPAGNVYQVSSQWNSKEVLSGLSYPAAIRFDKEGDLYIAVSGENVIKRFSTGSWKSSVIAGTQGVAGYVNGIGTAAKFDHPWGLALDAAGNLLVAGNGTWDGGSYNTDQSIRYIQAGTWNVTTFAGSGSAGYADAIGEAAAFSAPGGVAVDKNGTVYVLDKNNNRIRKIVSE